MVCLIKYDNKVKSSYRLCRIAEIKPDKDDVVRSVTVHLRPKDNREPLLSYQPKKPYVMEIGVQRLAFICPNEEFGKED